MDFSDWLPGVFGLVGTGLGGWVTFSVASKRLKHDQEVAARTLKSQEDRDEAERQEQRWRDSHAHAQTLADGYEQLRIGVQFHEGRSDSKNPLLTEIAVVVFQIVPSLQSEVPWLTKPIFRDELVRVNQAINAVSTLALLGQTTQAGLIRGLADYGREIAISYTRGDTTPPEDTYQTMRRYRALERHVTATVPENTQFQGRLSTSFSNDQKPPTPPNEG